MAHSTQAAHGHMQDHEGHVEAIEADLEYWRGKRLEPSVLQLHRRGVVTLYDLLRAAAHVPPVPAPADQADTEGRIRALEDGLDEYIRGIGLVAIDSPDHSFVIEDMRKERGDYDDSSASAPSSPGAAPGTAPASWRAPGSIPPSSRPSSRAAARRCVS